MPESLASGSSTRTKILFRSLLLDTVVFQVVTVKQALSWLQVTPKEEAQMHKQMHKMICGCGTGAPERTAIAVWSDFCAVAPSPDLKQRLKAELNQVRSSGRPLAAN